MQHWSKITPEDARDIRLPDPDIVGPLNEAGEPCPWPWEVQQLRDLALGQFHCRWCGALVLAGVPHLDYRDVVGWDFNRPSPAPAPGEPGTVQSLLRKLFIDAHLAYSPSSRYGNWDDTAWVRGQSSRDVTVLTRAEEDALRYYLGMGIQYVTEPNEKPEEFDAQE